MLRNAIVANADAVIAIGGGAGTLSEIAFAWAMMRLVLACEDVDGWSSKVANTKMDHRVRYDYIPEDMVYGVSNADEVIEILNKYIDKYTKYHKAIVMGV